MDIHPFATIQDVLSYCTKKDLKGLYYMSDDIYFNDQCPGISRSKLQKMLPSPQHFRLSDLRNKHEESEALRFGSMFHLAMENWDKFNRLYHQAPVFKGPRGGKLTGEKKLAAINEWEKESGCKAITAEEKSCITYMRWSIKKNPVFKQEFGLAYPELVAIARDPKYGILMKCKMDLLVVKEQSILIGDYKTCKLFDLENEHSILRVICDRKNPLYYQYAYYQYILDILGFSTEMKFIFVEKEAPYCNRVVTLDDQFLELGAKLVHKNLGELARGRKKKYWPGYDSKIKINFPKYLEKEMEELDYD